MKKMKIHFQPKRIDNLEQLIKENKEIKYKKIKF